VLGRPAGSARSTLEIAAGGAVSGNAGCNNYQGSVELEDELVRFGPLAATRMMCPPAIAGQETVFLDALEGAAAWDRQGESLLLLDSEGAVTLKFELLP
jgi:heat shock protein HslJ